MSERPVGLSFLRKAIARLDAGLTRYRQDIHDEQIRDCLIQRFEFTYEISHETLKRFLKASSASPQEPGLGRALYPGFRLQPTPLTSPAVPTARVAPVAVMVLVIGVMALGRCAAIMARSGARGAMGPFAATVASTGEWRLPV